MSNEHRILTTHVGSLPRPQEVVDVVFAEDRGEEVDRAHYDQVIRDAVSDRVQHQVDAGIDLVSDGEMSKIGYATYIRHRLSGFEVGDVPRATPADLDAFPRFRDRLAKEGGSARYLRPICRGPITYEHREPLERDLANLKAAIDGHDVAGAFMNAPSPGVIALFQPNEYYDTIDEYLDAIGEAMKTEYEAIVAAGLQLQIDAPDLAMGRHIMYRDRSDEEFVASAARHIEAINHALRDVPADRVRLHVCWGNYEVRTTSTSGSRRSSTWCCGRSRPRSCSRPPTRDTPTTGRPGARRRSPTTRCSPPACWTRPRTTSSTPSWSRSVSRPMSRSSGQTG